MPNFDDAIQALSERVGFLEDEALREQPTLDRLMASWTEVTDRQAAARDKAEALRDAITCLRNQSA